MEGRGVNSSLNYRYGFNGKENDNEVKGVEGSQLDFGARIYDPRLGRWLSIDPMANERIGLTPYNFVQNTPIKKIDPTGALDDDYYFNKKGEMVGHTETDTKDKIFVEDDKGTETLTGSDLKFSENKNPGFGIVKIKIDMSNFKGHTGIGIDGKMYGFYPTDLNGDHSYGPSENNTPLVLQTVSNSDFNIRYPKANTYYLILSDNEKNNLISWINVQGEAIKQGTGGNFTVTTNNCTTNVCKALNFTFGKPILSNIIIKPSWLDTELGDKTYDPASSRILKSEIKDFGNNFTNAKH